MTLCSVYPIGNYNRKMGGVQVLPVPCSQLIEVEQYVKNGVNLYLRTPSKFELELVKIAGCLY